MSHGYPARRDSNLGAADMTGPRCVARFEFEGVTEEDLSFPAGATIRLLERHGADWLKGDLDGRTGIFPATFVEVVEDLPLPSDAHTLGGS